jgi:hypothetical protein
MFFVNFPPSLSLSLSWGLSQLADEDFMSPLEQAAAMRWFTIVTVMGVLGIPFVGYSMVRNNKLAILLLLFETRLIPLSATA